MATRDPYDPVVAFDDIYIGEPAQSDPEPAHRARNRGAPHQAPVARAIFRRAARRRLAPPQFSVHVVGSDPTPKSFSVQMSSLVPRGFDYSHYNALTDKGYISDYSIIGDSGRQFPLFDAIRRRYAAALPRPKLVRYDTRRTYVGFREERRKPYVKELESRLSALERAVAEHVSDNHGGGRVARLEDAFEDQINNWHSSAIDVFGADADHAAARAAHGGDRIALPLPPWARGKIECWQDGREILCTVKFPGADGQVRYATTGTDVSPHVDEALVGAIGARVPIEQFVEVAPAVVQVLGGSALVAELCAAAPEIILAPEGRGTYVGVLQPEADPGLAAAMTLLQRSQRGDGRAAREAEAIARTHEPLLRRAAGRLLHAQALKRRRK